MTNYQNSKELKKLTLGKSTAYTTQYNANLLQAVPRSLNRDSLSLSANTLPFLGEDVWYGYELSWLNSKGKPMVAVAEFRFCCTSPNLVESKSFKLYLNSFNQTKFDSIEQVQTTLREDLSNCSGTSAKVSLFAVDACAALTIASPKSLCIDDIDINIEHYKFKPDLLADKSEQNQSPVSKTAARSEQELELDIIEESLVSHLLKSNCLITNQPDWASIYIDYKGEKISHSALLKYLISFRQHNEFHEQCVERIFCDLQKYYQLEQLTVFARYTRRGGLDINPFRSTHLKQAPNLRTLRQ